MPHTDQMLIIKMMGIVRMDDVVDDDNAADDDDDDDDVVDDNDDDGDDGNAEIDKRTEGEED